MDESLKIQPVLEGEIFPNRVESVKRMYGFYGGYVIFPFPVQNHQSPKHAF